MCPPHHHQDHHHDFSDLVEEEEVCEVRRRPQVNSLAWLGCHALVVIMIWYKLA